MIRREIQDWALQEDICILVPQVVWVLNKKRCKPNSPAFGRQSHKNIKTYPKHACCFQILLEGSVSKYSVCSSALMYNQQIWRREGIQEKYHLCLSFIVSSLGIIFGLWAKLQLLFCYANRNYMLSQKVSDQPISLEMNIPFHCTFNSSRSGANSVTKFLICMIYISTYIST